MACAPCIVCGKELDECFNQAGMTGTVNQPSDGTAFNTWGHYGSTVYDPCIPNQPDHIEVNVCDRCLVRAASQGRVLHFQKPGDTFPTPWRPEGFAEDARWGDLTEDDIDRLFLDREERFADALAEQEAAYSERERDV